VDKAAEREFAPKAPESCLHHPYILPPPLITHTHSGEKRRVEEKFHLVLE
jgi:hypothetical protein